MSFRLRRVFALAGSLAFLFVFPAAALVSGLRVNLTPSYPLGLWQIEPLDRAVAVGDRVFICPPETATFAVVRERRYLGRGLCPGWFSPLIKTVVAVAGQRVVIGGSIAVDGIDLPHSSVRLVDGEGRALSPAAGGIVPAGHLFLLSDYEGSYDSRYFGALPAVGVLGLARPVLIWSP